MSKEKRPVSTLWNTVCVVQETGKYLKGFFFVFLMFCFVLFFVYLCMYVEMTEDGDKRTFLKLILARFQFDLREHQCKRIRHKAEENVFCLVPFCNN